MKKGLLLSIAASAVVFAGGDIAPVEPVQPAPAAAPAACDFWGSLAARYDANKIETSADEFGSYDDKATLAVVLGVEKDLGYGFGFGAELGASMWANFDPFAKGETAELSQLYLTYKYGNTAVKAGRMALPKAVSPLAFSDRTAGVVDRAYNGVTVVNTDLADTTLVGAWFDSVADDNTNTRIRLAENGLFMLGAINKSIENTTLSTAVYFAQGEAGKVFTEDYLSVWGAAESSISGINVGLQGVYAKDDNYDDDETYGVAGYVGTNYNGFDVKLTLAYLNDGKASIKYTGNGSASGFWGGTYYLFGGDINTDKGEQKIARLDLGYNIDGYGKVYGGVAADKSDLPETEIAARVGYKFNVAGVDAKVEYRYYQDGSSAQNQKHRIRVEGVYKF